jgi:hypothetical protein
MVTLGTGQVQSAPMLVRYPDTAYRAHGNYGVLYSLTLPLLNNTGEPQTVTLAIQTPDKQENRRNELHFLEPPMVRYFFEARFRLVITMIWAFLKLYIYIWNSDAVNRVSLWLC